MSQRDNFSGGFLLGAVFGGIVGGALGAVVASRVLNPQSEEPLLSASQADPQTSKAKRRSLKAANGQAEMEVARRSLEDKIAQLNDAIDDVRQQLGGVNGATEAGARSTIREP